MTAGLKRLRKIQFGRETVPGTPVAATTHWRGEGQLVDNTEMAFPAEDVGQMIGMTRNYIKKKAAAMTLAEGPATFEQVLYPLSASIYNLAAGTQDGTGSGYVWTYPFPTDSRPTFHTFTMRAGDDQGVDLIEYCYCEKWAVNGAGEDAFMMSSDWQGRQATPGSSFTAAIPFPTVEEILFGNAILYIDDSDTYPATTQVTESFVKCALSAEELLKGVFTGDGNGQVFTFVKPKAPKFTLTVTFEHDTQAIAEKAARLAGTERAVRIIAEGSALSSAGTEYSNKTFIIDAVGLWGAFTGLEEDDGNDQVTGTLEIRYSPTAGTAGRIIVVNEVATLP